MKFFYHQSTHEVWIFLKAKTSQGKTRVKFCIGSKQKALIYLVNHTLAETQSTDNLIAQPNKCITKWNLVEKCKWIDFFH